MNLVGAGGGQGGGGKNVNSPLCPIDRLSPPLCISLNI